MGAPPASRVSHDSVCVTSTIAVCRADRVRETVTTVSGRLLNAVKRKYTSMSFLAVANMDLPTLSTPWRKRTRGAT